MKELEGNLPVNLHRIFDIEVENLKQHDVEVAMEAKMEAIQRENVELFDIFNSEHMLKVKTMDFSQLRSVLSKLAMNINLEQVAKLEEHTI
jgi:hypothetical protein